MLVRRGAVLVMTLFCLVLAGCGGGGGSSSPPASNVAMVTLSVQGTTGTIGAVDVTVDLPAGVTVASDASNNYVVSSGVLTAVGSASNSIVVGRFIPATATTPAKVRIAVINSVGFAAGEFLTMKCDIAPGTTPQASGFSVEPGASVIDGAGQALPGASVVLAVTL